MAQQKQKTERYMRQRENAHKLNVLRVQWFCQYMDGELPPFYRMGISRDNSVILSHEEACKLSRLIQAGNAARVLASRHDGSAHVQESIVREEDDIAAELAKAGYDPETIDDRTMKRVLRVVDEAKQARWMFASKNLGLVSNFAGRKRRMKNLSQGEYDEIVEAGRRGLMTAIDKFNPELGFRFSTPATHWITQGIEEHLNANQTIKVPPYMNAIHKDMQYAQSQLHNLGYNEEDITDEMILAYLNDPKRDRKRKQSDLDNARRYRVETVSMELPQGDDGSARTLNDVLADERGVDDVAFVEEQDDAGFEKLIALVASEEKRDILRDIYTSPNDSDVAVISNLSRKYGMTTAAFKKLRREAEEEIKEKLLALGMVGARGTLTI